MSRTALPKSVPSSYSVTPSRYCGRVSWYSRSPMASTVITTMAAFT